MSGAAAPDWPSLAGRQLVPWKVACSRESPAGHHGTKELLVMDDADIQALLQELDELMAVYQAWLHKTIYMLAHKGSD
jgi:hypothetical protein